MEVAASFLLLVLSFLEYVRPGFVSRVFDLRIAVFLVLFAWIYVTARAKQSSSLIGKAIAAGAVVLSAFILYNITQPFGRLGIATFVLGLIVLIFVWQTASSAES